MPGRRLGQIGDFTLHPKVGKAVFQQISHMLIEQRDGEDLALCSHSGVIIVDLVLGDSSLMMVIMAASAQCFRRYH